MSFASIFTAEEWTALSAIGTVVAAAVATLGLPFIAFQIRRARQTADLQSAQEFLKATTACEAALLKATTPADQEQAFLEFGNLLELWSAVLEDGLLKGVSARFVREKIVDSVATIELSGTWTEKLQAARSSPTAFIHLFRFINTHRRHIEKVTSHMR